MKHHSNQRTLNPNGLQTALPPEIERKLQSIESLAQLMDSRFSVPGTKFRIGLDTVIGVLPVIGDTAGLMVSGYIVTRAAAFGVRKRTLSRMSVNIFADWLIGLVPLIGDVFDAGWKANNRNSALLRRELQRRYQA